MSRFDIDPGTYRSDDAASTARSISEKWGLGGDEKAARIHTLGFTVRPDPERIERVKKRYIERHGQHSADRITYWDEEEFSCGDPFVYEARPSMHFRPLALQISTGVPSETFYPRPDGARNELFERLLIEDIRIGRETLLLSSAPLPAHLFEAHPLHDESGKLTLPASPIPFVRTCLPGDVMSVHFRWRDKYRDWESVRFHGTVYVIGMVAS